MKINTLLLKMGRLNKQHPIFHVFPPLIVTPKTLKGFGDPTPRLFQKRKDQYLKIISPRNATISPL